MYANAEQQEDFFQQQQAHDAEIAEQEQENFEETPLSKWEAEREKTLTQRRCVLCGS